jgi:hypothetical protein
LPPHHTNNKYRLRNLEKRDRNTTFRDIGLYQTINKYRLRNMERKKDKNTTYRGFGSTKKYNI